MRLTPADLVCPSGSGRMVQILALVNAVVPASSRDVMWIGDEIWEWECPWEISGGSPVASGWAWEWMR